MRRRSEQISEKGRGKVIFKGSKGTYRLCDLRSKTDVGWWGKNSVKTKRQKEIVRVRKRLDRLNFPRFEVAALLHTERPCCGTVTRRRRCTPKKPATPQHGCHLPTGGGIV